MSLNRIVSLTLVLAAVGFWYGLRIVAARRGGTWERPCEGLLWTPHVDYGRWSRARPTGPGWARDHRHIIRFRQPEAGSDELEGKLDGGHHRHQGTAGRD